MVFLLVLTFTNNFFKQVNEEIGKKETGIDMHITMEGRSWDIAFHFGIIIIIRATTTYTTFSELFCVNWWGKVEPPGITCHRVLPVNKAFRSLSYSCSCTKKRQKIWMNGKIKTMVKVERKGVDYLRLYICSVIAIASRCVLGLWPCYVVLQYLIKIRQSDTIASAIFYTCIMHFHHPPSFPALWNKFWSVREHVYHIQLREVCSLPCHCCALKMEDKKERSRFFLPSSSCRFVLVFLYKKGTMNRRRYMQFCNTVTVYF